MSTLCGMTTISSTRNLRTPRRDDKEVYKLGDKVCVRVADADKMLKTVDFELVADIWNDEEEN